MSTRTTPIICDILAVKNSTQYATETQIVIYLCTADGNWRLVRPCLVDGLKEPGKNKNPPCSLSFCIQYIFPPQAAYPCLPRGCRCLSSVSLWPPLPLDGERVRVLGLLELLMPMEALRWPCRNTPSPIKTLKVIWKLTTITV